MQRIMKTQGEWIGEKRNGTLKKPQSDNMME